MSFKIGNGKVQTNFTSVSKKGNMSNTRDKIKVNHKKKSGVSKIYIKNLKSKRKNH